MKGRKSGKLVVVFNDKSPGKQFTGAFLNCRSKVAELMAV